MRPSRFHTQDWEFFYPLHLEGGLMGALRAAARTWVGYGLRLIVLNVLWALSFFTIFGFAPVTAALFYNARHALAEEYIGWDSFWYPARRYAGPATRWLLSFVALALLALATLGLARNGLPAAHGPLRAVWTLLMGAWGGLNLLFWPLWFAQLPDRRSLRGTWRHCLAFVRAHPLPAVLPLLLAVALTWLALRLLTAFWFATVFMVWPALLASAVVSTHLPDDFG